ncbi:class I SAM-dependent methyltransferase [uncultured Mucilaginibacter sp.]|uniref:class I SAM-dependent methyltransferase n=1 Tax=uncultured Mucilaginibacter sp. TaxID=797541 RepID=UPI00261F5B2E|nr:class I SAM-dependent methyltransferase [uncultured Mucilaginibacter sp.]
MPHWLDEAYSSAITKQDIGLVHRNLSFAPIVSCLISFIFNKKGRFIDFGGGYGLLTRIMRDKGYEYYRYDTYCENLFAKDFDKVSPASPDYELLTAFELFEHLVNPVEELKEMLKWSTNIFFSTEIQKPDLKSPEDWWYIMPETGQHIAFYTVKSLRLLGEKFNLNFYTNGVNLHLFTKNKISPIKFKLSTTYLSAKLLDYFASKNESLLMKDYNLSKV